MLGSFVKSNMRSYFLVAFAIAANEPSVAAVLDMVLVPQESSRAGARRLGDALGRRFLEQYQYGDDAQQWRNGMRL
jgi:hypothetical protein